MCKEAYGVNTSFISNAASIDLDFSAALTEIEEVRQTISARRSRTEEWIGHDLAVYRQAETLRRMLGASITCPHSVSSQVYRV